MRRVLPNSSHFQTEAIVFFIIISCFVVYMLYVSAVGWTKPASSHV